MEHQGQWESENLWQAVTLAINNDDQVAATEAKTVLEEAQRERARERKNIGQEWIPKYFAQVRILGTIARDVSQYQFCEMQNSFSIPFLLLTGYNLRKLDVSSRGSAALGSTQRRSPVRV